MKTTPSRQPRQPIAKSRTDTRKQAMRQFLIAALLLMAAFILMPGAHAAAPPPEPEARADQPVVHHLLDAMAKNDYQGFINRGTPDFAQISEAEFNEVANSIGARLEQGYTVQYLGRLTQQGLDISVWKVSFSDNGDDLLATLNVQDGNVGGFFLR